MQTSSSSSATQQTQLEAGPVSAALEPPAEILRLRLVPRRKKKKAVRWSEDVVDNEHMNKKSSKQCCIFHKQRAFGDFSDSDDEDLPATCSGASEAEGT
ncbi:hypothetical protein WJX73_008334 [Symbiochloris irregularis]|uniref:Protein phosphatase 1 regulatory subunit 11 n=1 Tax=Symbiochloris irregularis TaxID=706552 RepID=A0AAW1PGZ4_9CHLO